MRDWLIPLAAGLGVAGLATVFILAVVGALRLVEHPPRARRPDDNQQAVHGDVPELPDDWPGKVKRRRAF